ncbi:hypothetical protein RDWZM_006458 [Blomia tropicalis]|uniref:phosphatidylinositol 3-kinase n=1 Tax=Blomia tropicalis TaxID=40697 RepID=A0A9Q0RPC7_BLOTA|nr:hypothetical protein RDWZM_006458 [Blomia tropicalis]
MPNGTLIELNLPLDYTFAEIKVELFETAQRGPMFGVLGDPKIYIFNYVDKDLGQRKQIDDEQLRLIDVAPFCGFCELKKQEADSAALELDEQIGRLIGKPLTDFDSLHNPEVNEFRYRMRSLCEEIVKTRQSNSWLEKMRYAFPCEVDRMVEAPKYILQRISSDGYVHVQVFFDRPSIAIDMTVHHMVTADELIQLTIRHLANDPRQRNVFEQILSEVENESFLYDTSFESTDPIKMICTNNYYLLKIEGCLEYLLGNYRLIQYKMIQKILLSDQTIRLIAVRRLSIEFEDESIYSVPEFTQPKSRPRSQSVISLGSLSSIVALSSRRRPKVLSSWLIDRKLVIHINTLSKIGSVDDQPVVNHIAIMVGIFHGDKLLCNHIMTPPKPLNDDSDEIEFGMDIVFTLKVSDLPRMARICFAVVGWTGSVSGSKKLSKSTSIAAIQQRPNQLICWGNMNFFDYRGILRETATTVGMWGRTESDAIEDVSDADPMEKFFNPLGTVVQSSQEAGYPLLTVAFTKYHDGDKDQVIKYPEMREIVKLYQPEQIVGANSTKQPTMESFPEETSFDDSVLDNRNSSTNINKNTSSGKEESEYEFNNNNNRSLNENDPAIRRTSSMSNPSNHRTAWTQKPSVTFENSDSNDSEWKINPKLSTKSHGSKQLLKQISEFCDRDLLYKMTDSERELLWMLREDCQRQLPNALNKLLLSFKWNNQKEIGQALALLQFWPKISPTKALELLDYAYPDSAVRKYAVECLKELSHDDLSQYLLQIVQALKHESYIYNDLVRFLLERALENQRIGHTLFWLLRSEMHDPTVSISYGLILEAYCRGAVDHIHILQRQVDCINRLIRIQNIITQDKSRDSREKKIGQMQDMLMQKYYMDTLHSWISPLNPLCKLGKLKISKCRFMDSKMKPLWLVFENPDSSAGDVYMIFKCGDDLRQDMLTLQMIKIMDSLWKQAGYDFRMTPYGVVSLGKNVGMIEVVLNSQTIANIQKEKSTSAMVAAFKRGSLYGWIKEHNQTEEALNKAIEEFTMSCVGYCVATYVLGVADRHNDNLMVSKNGQLFHIDFGHILGKFKSKFGIRRERVPFVITHDFVYVITHGKEKKDRAGMLWARFQEHCEIAYLIIRKNADLIISLFSMMLGTGIAEVSNEEDLQYLRDTLQIDITEEQARLHFRNKLTEAVRNSWKTSINWSAHNIAKDNV